MVPRWPRSVKQHLELHGEQILPALPQIGTTPACAAAARPGSGRGVFFRYREVTPQHSHDFEVGGGVEDSKDTPLGMVPKRVAGFENLPSLRSAGSVATVRPAQDSLSLAGFLRSFAHTLSRET